MDWSPVVTERSTKGCDLAIAVVVAAGLLVMLLTGIPWVSPFVFSLPAAIVIALCLHHRRQRPQLNLIALGHKIKSK